MDVNITIMFIVACLTVAVLVCAVLEYKREVKKNGKCPSYEKGYTEGYEAGVKSVICSKEDRV